MLSKKKEKTEEEKEKIRFAELEDAIFEEEKEHAFLLKETYRQITEKRDDPGVNKKRLKLESRLCEIVDALEKQIEVKEKLIGMA